MTFLKMVTRAFQFTIASWLIGWCVLAAAQPAGFNYDESQVPDYKLPDPLILNDGTPVQNSTTWEEKRRPEILEAFRREVYGRSPQPRDDMHFEIVESTDNALNNEAVRKQVKVYFSNDREGPQMEILIYLPKGTERPVPIFLGLNFQGNHSIHSDPAIHLNEGWIRGGTGVEANRATEAARGSKSSRWPVEMILGRGYGLATIYYGDIDPDFDDDFKNGVHPLFKDAMQSVPDGQRWGSIAAWAWGLSRAVDYFETDADIDAARIAVLGHSRLGKTALWAGARDERFALVISNNSGCGGAALSRRRFGETVARINEVLPHWFCDNFPAYNDREDKLPVDQHMLIALMAPRPVYVASAEQDQWADPRGEFLSCVHARPVFELLDRDVFDQDEMPPTNQPIMSTIGYHIRQGEHDVKEYDWAQYLEFADKWVK